MQLPLSMMVMDSHSWDGNGNCPMWNGVGMVFGYDALFVTISAKFDIKVEGNMVDQ